MSSTVFKIKVNPLILTHANKEIRIILIYWRMARLLRKVSCLKKELIEKYEIPIYVMYSKEP